MEACNDVTMRGPRLSRQSFQQFAELITRELGIKMSLEKIPMVQSRLQRRLRALGLPSLDAYWEVLAHSAQAEQELVDFIDAITTNKTDFFREPQHFEFLTQNALPGLDPGADRAWPFRVWCAGCASGEEAYTLAMVLAEFGAVRPGFEFRILATDVSTRVLETARLAIYDDIRIEPVPPPIRSRHLLRSRDPRRGEVRVRPGLRARVEFRRLNFMELDYRIRERFEVIFFRNVMIYFDKPTQEAVIARICRNLEPGGYLFVGHSESLAGLDVPVTCAGPAIYRKPARA